MIDADITAEMLLQPANDLRRQRDLRKQIEHLFALPDHLFDLSDIHLRLAAGRHAMEKTDRSLRECGIHLAVSGLLRWCQLEPYINIPRQPTDTIDRSLLYA